MQNNLLNTKNFNVGYASLEIIFTNSKNSQVKKKLFNVHRIMYLLIFPFQRISKIKGENHSAFEIQERSH